MKIFILPILNFIWAIFCLLFTYFFTALMEVCYFLWFFKPLPRRWYNYTTKLSLSPYQKDLEDECIYLWKHYFMYVLGFTPSAKVYKPNDHTWNLLCITEYSYATFMVMRGGGENPTYDVVELIDGHMITNDLRKSFKTYDDAVKHSKSIIGYGGIAYSGELATDDYL